MLKYNGIRIVSIIAFVKCSSVKLQPLLKNIIFEVVLVFYIWKKITEIIKKNKTEANKNKIQQTKKQTPKTEQQPLKSTER